MLLIDTAEKLFLTVNRLRKIMENTNLRQITNSLLCMYNVYVFVQAHVCGGQKSMLGMFHDRIPPYF